MRVCSVATSVEKYAAVEALLDERGHRLRAATKVARHRASRGYYGDDPLVSDATGLSRPTIRQRIANKLESGGAELGRAGPNRPDAGQSQTGIKRALDRLGLIPDPG